MGKDIWGNEEGRDVYGNSPNQNAWGNSPRDIQGNRTDRDIYGNPRDEDEDRDRRRNNNQESSSGLCFLTTACTEARNLPDDCVELQTLRNFRDTYIASLPDGKDQIAEYYRVAPEIVEKIKRRPDSQKILDEIYCKIDQAVQLISRHQKAEAFTLYKQLVTSLQTRYVTEPV